MLKDLKNEELANYLKDLEEAREQKEDADDLLVSLIGISKSEIVDEPCEAGCKRK